MSNFNKMLKPTIFIVEDEVAISEVLKYGLQKSGYNVKVASDGSTAVAEIKDASPDLILLDWMLPNKSGIEILSELRVDPTVANIPIIMISAKGDDLDKVTGLDRGADDYIVKPFSSAELVARIKAVFKRMRPAFSNVELSFGDIIMDLAKHCVSRNGKKIKLAPIEFQILQILIENPERVLSRQDLIDKIWGSDIYVGSRTVDVHITRLRKALLDASADKKDIIKTIRLAGYTLRAD